MQLQADLPAPEVAGVRPVAPSCDRPAAVAAFVAERGVTSPLLADAGNAVMRRLGLLNTAIPVGCEYPVRGQILALAGLEC